MDFKSIDWGQFKRLTDPQAVKDLDKFLDRLPITVGYNALIAAGVVWLFAGAAVLFATTQASKVSELRTELLAVESLRPPVPRIDHTPVGRATLESFINSITRAELYPVLNFNVSADGRLRITGNDREFTAMTYAIGHIQGGGRNWLVEIESMCIGSECSGNSLQTELKISTIRIVDANN